MFLTKNFSYKEFRPSGTPETWMPENEIQDLMIKIIAGNLQIVRDNLNPFIKMKITSGVRSLEDFIRLKNSGYNPSTTSYHNFGVVPIEKTDIIKYKKYGAFYPFACGATDVLPVGISVKELFLKAMELVEAGKCRFGQIIHEYTPAQNGKPKMEWVHFGNDPLYFFSKEICNTINKVKFLYTIDGGKNYKQYFK